MEDERQNATGCLLGLLLPALMLWSARGPWDYNGDGAFTISDVGSYFGAVLTQPYVLLYEAAPTIFAFLEIDPPLQPTYGTAVLGVLIAFAASWLFGYIVAGLVFSFGKHWGMIKP